MFWYTESSIHSGLDSGMCSLCRQLRIQSWTSKQTKVVSKNSWSQNRCTADSLQQWGGSSLPEHSLLLYSQFHFLILDKIPEYRRTGIRNSLGSAASLCCTNHGFDILHDDVWSFSVVCYVHLRSVFDGKLCMWGLVPHLLETKSTGLQ